MEIIALIKEKGDTGVRSVCLSLCTLDIAGKVIYGGCYHRGREGGRSRGVVFLVKLDIRNGFNSISKADMQGILSMLRNDLRNRSSMRHWKVRRGRDLS